MIDVCVLGPSGRMGQQVSELCLRSDVVRLVSAVEHAGAPAVGSCVQNSSVIISDSLEEALAQAQVYIDFTTPASTKLAAEKACAHKTSAIVGTTGLDEAARHALDKLAQVAPVFVAANFSAGVALLYHLAETAAAALGADYDLEVLEMHHRNKVDAPSGTALALGDALAKGRGQSLKLAQRNSHDSQVGPRSTSEIGIASLRGGDIVGEHTALLIGNEERIEITHRAQKRSVFATGALRAAIWAVEQPAGHYGMSDLLGI